jgi:hypothetical protein
MSDLFRVAGTRLLDELQPPPLESDYEFLPATSEAVIQLAVFQLRVRRLASK